MQEVQQELQNLRQQQVQQISNLLQEAAALRTRVEAQQTALAVLTEKDRTQADNLRRLAGELEALEANVHSMANSLAALRGEMAAIHGKVAASASDDEELTTRIEQLQAGFPIPIRIGFVFTELLDPDSNFEYGSGYCCLQKPSIFEESPQKTSKYRCSFFLSF